MLKIENTEVLGWEHAIRGMRNPMNSWAKSDSEVSVCECERWPHDVKKSFACLGSNDLDLMKRLRNAGTDHRKFMRMITVYVDLIGPLYWWKEFDTYKVGTTANSTSTMHKIHAKPFSAEDFSCERMLPEARESLEQTIAVLENLRLRYLETKDKTLWYSMIQLLPSSYNQMRTCTMTYENLVNMYFARRHHKLDEWHVYCAWVASLPYFKALFLTEEEEK